MSRYQAIFSIICMLAAATGLYAIVQKIVSGSTSGTWTLFCLLGCLALVMTRIIDRLPMTHEAGFRVASAHHWHDLSKFQRYALIFFDLPLFLAIRDREAQRLFCEPLIRVAREAEGITLEPVEGQHGTPFFLKTIASAMAIHGVRTRVDFPRLSIVQAGAGKVRFVDGDQRILRYVRDQLADGELVPLRNVVRMVELGYISTLPENERHTYTMWAMR